MFKGFIDLLSSMEVFWNLYDVINILFSDWMRRILIVIPIDRFILYGLFKGIGFLNPRNRTGTFKKFYDVIKMLLFDWVTIIFIVLLGQIHLHWWLDIKGVCRPPEFNGSILKHVWRHQNTVFWLVVTSI